MGGAITLELLIKQRRLFEAGIIINSGASLKILPLILKKIREKNKKEVNFENLFTELAISEKSDPAKIIPLVAASSNSNTQVTINDIHACNTFNVKKELRDIDVPVLIMTSEDDILTPAKNGHYLAENIKGSKIIHIKNAGHLSPIEQPDEVNSAILNFVTETFQYRALKN